MICLVCAVKVWVELNLRSSKKRPHTHAHATPFTNLNQVCEKSKLHLGSNVPSSSGSVHMVLSQREKDFKILRPLAARPLGGLGKASSSGSSRFVI